MHASLRHDTVVYARETEVVEAINDSSIRENTVFLKVCIVFSLHLVSCQASLQCDCQQVLIPGLRMLCGIVYTRGSLITRLLGRQV